MNVMSKTDRAMRMRVKLLRSCISFWLKTQIERPLPRSPKENGNEKLKIIMKEGAVIS